MHGEVNRSLGVIERAEAICLEIRSCLIGSQASLQTYNVKCCFLAYVVEGITCPGDLTFFACSLSGRTINKG